MIVDNTLDAPTSLDIHLDSIHLDLMKLSDKDTIQYNFNNFKYIVTSIFDEIIDGEKYYKYTITLPNGELLNNLSFYETYSFFENLLCE